MVTDGFLPLIVWPDHDGCLGGKTASMEFTNSSAAREIRDQWEPVDKTPV
jgi:hypothetical protein